MSHIKTTLAKYRLRPKKRLGQNFLQDEEALETIVRAACISKNDYVLEIGSGIGNLSKLLAENSLKFYTLEKDRGFEKVLKEALGKFSNTDIIFNDILEFELKTLIPPGKKIKIVANLPYYITTGILTHLIRQREYIDSILVTTQKEVAQRIIAKPGNKDFGRLSCLLQFYTKPEIIAVFSKNMFFPRPEVDSALIKLSVLKSPSITVKSEKTFFSTVKAIFAQRRKTLLNGLIRGGWGLKKEQLCEILKKVDIVPSIRGEQLSLSQIAKLADEIHGYV